jgi:hypothetical protein
MWYFNLVHELDAFQLGSTALLLEFNFPRFAGNYYAEKKLNSSNGDMPIKLIPTYLA